MKIKKGDKVHIIRGKDSGKTGKVVKTFPDTNQIVVQGINIFAKHTRPRREGEKGQILQIPAPLDVSKVMKICDKCGKPTRVGAKIEGDMKHRVCKQCGEVM